MPKAHLFLNPKAAVLKPGKEKALLNRHCWIFSGAIAKLPDFTDGDILPVYSAQGQQLGCAYFNRKSSIVGRMLAFGDQVPERAILERLQCAVNFRKELFDRQHTNAYRLVNGEGDGLPGLIVDVYDDVLVLQIATLGMEKLKSFIVQWLIENLQPKSIYEKSNLVTRREEGLEAYEGLLYGQQVGLVEIKEHNVRFLVDVVHGQKTGFFLDQREMRCKVANLAFAKRVLNCFAYTGGFSLYALQGQAAWVDSVDISEQAINLAKQNATLNGYATDRLGFYCANVFEFLHQRSLDYDLVILDPPAFAKKQKDIVPACRGYKEINRVAMQKMPAGSFLLTCSCSFHVSADLFQKVTFQASIEAGRQARIVGRHILAADHPINICHPEGEYLKSLLLYAAVKKSL